MWCVANHRNVQDVRMQCHADELMCMIWCTMSHTFEHSRHQQVNCCMHHVLPNIGRPLLPCCWGYSLGLFHSWYVEICFFFGTTTFALVDFLWLPSHKSLASKMLLADETRSMIPLFTISCHFPVYVLLPGFAEGNIYRKEPDIYIYIYIEIYLYIILHVGSKIMVPFSPKGTSVKMCDPFPLSVYQTPWWNTWFTMRLLLIVGMGRSQQQDLQPFMVQPLRSWKGPDVCWVLPWPRDDFV